MNWTLLALCFSVGVNVMMIVVCIRMYRWFDDYVELVNNVSCITDALETLTKIVREMIRREIGQIREDLKDSGDDM